MRTLHAAYRVTDLAGSLEFYAALGYSEIGRVEFEEGASLTMLKLPADEFVSLELVHRPRDGAVERHGGFSHLAVQVDDLASTCARLVVAGLEPGPIEDAHGVGVCSGRRRF